MGSGVGPQPVTATVRQSLLGLPTKAGANIFL
jgi:hypothetical protein